MRPCRPVLLPPLDSVDGEGKFVQFIWRGVEYLLFATRDTHRFHNQMLAQFLDEHGVEHRWLDSQTLDFDPDEVQVLGGGRFRLDRQQQLLTLWDNSTAYGRFDESGLEARIHSAGSPWERIRVRID